MCPFLYVVQPVFFCRPRHLPPSKVPCRMIFEMVLCRVIWPGELSSFHCCQQGLLLSSEGIHLLSHIFICFVFSIRNTEETAEAFHFKCLYAFLCICCQGPALASLEEDGYSECSVELQLDLEADVSALPDDVRS